MRKLKWNSKPSGTRQWQFLELRAVPTLDNDGRAWSNNPTDTQQLGNLKIIVKNNFLNAEIWRVSTLVRLIETD